ncbi:MAG: MBL fold metallo-hydrolase [Dehalococcoidales bacterium]|jgi:glyoxylase-like metal-dependent hydrolase (beta-lactamase superfamily II)
MDKLKILIPGYARKGAFGRYKATSMAVLVESEGKNVLIDPGLYPRDLKAALQRENLRIEDIDIVTFTHSHTDHARNCKLFAKNKVIDFFSLYKQIPENLVIPGTQIQVIYTPGHVPKHISFLATTAEGKYAIAGDVFWWEDSETQETDTASLLAHVDPLAKDEALLKKSRQKLLSIADYSIPGHGKTFQAPR